MQICRAYALWECSEYGSIHKQFIGNLDGFLQNDFHLKSSFDKTKYIFDQSIWECNGHFDDWFSNTTRLFVWHTGLCQALYESI